MSLLQILCIGYVIKLINFLFCYMMVQSSKDYFLYFAYGSNLLKKRIHVNNPSAEFVGTGLLKDHQLDFVNYSMDWRGSVATIVPVEGEHVWGAVWKLNNVDLPALEKQEGVPDKIYFSKIVKIKTSNGIKECRTYQNTTIPPARKPDEDIPFDRRPSLTYKDCILRGAIECKLPENYIEILRKIPDNGHHAAQHLIDVL